MKLLGSSIISLLFILSSNLIWAAESNRAKLEKAVTGEHRSAENIARNQYRNPVETLTWFGIRDDMVVVEIAPGGGGWYTEVLAPFLQDRGKLYAASYNSESDREYAVRNSKKYLDKLAAASNVYDKVIVTEFEPPKKATLEPRGEADMVVSFRSAHGWMRDGVADQVFSAVFDVLKPGGVFGIVQHRGNPDMIGKDWWTKGYVPEALIINKAEAAGLKFVGRSEINANPKDTKDYDKGVWTLPPTYRLKDQDHEKYAAIGESDRMTLKFVKPE